MERNDPGKAKLDFDPVQKYVLPYRADNELLRIGWRDSLRATYAPVIRDAKTAREAFECLRKAVNSVKRKGKYDFHMSWMPWPYATTIPECALNGVYISRLSVGPSACQL